MDRVGDSFANAQGSALSASLGDLADGAIKTQHRPTEGDRSTGLLTERGNPGGVRVA